MRPKPISPAAPAPDSGEIRNLDFAGAFPISYNTPSEAADLLGGVTLTQAQLDAACAALIAYTGKRFQQQGEAAGGVELIEQHDGSRSEDLILERRPVVEVTEILLDGEDVSGELDETLFLDASRGILSRRAGWCRATLAPIQVTYTVAGSTNPPPANYKGAEAALAAFWRTHPDGGTLQSETLGNYSYTLASTDTPAEARILARFGISRRIVFA